MTAQRFENCRWLAIAVDFRAGNTLSRKADIAIGRSEPSTDEARSVNLVLIPYAFDRIRKWHHLLQSP